MLPEYIPAHFQLDGEITQVEPYGGGHIHDTYRVTLGGQRSILQRVNTYVFKHPEQLSANIERITSHLQAAAPEKPVLALIPTREGKPYYTDPSGGVWRMFTYIENSVAYRVAPHAGLIEEAGRAYGRFQRLLADFPAGDLYETIPGFHDTPKRYVQFREALEADNAGRADSAEAEIAFVEAHEDQMGVIVELLANGELPLRVSHNDTKLENVLFDQTSGEALCVVDLDTVMPGSLLYDFGDAVRSMTNTAEEDERRLGQVHFNMEYYADFARGFLTELNETITPLERELLPFSARLITLEIGMRFLTDYLAGDFYFKTDTPDHNLVRARTQFKLVEEMEHREGEMANVK